MINSLSVNLNMCFGCSEEPSHRDSSFEYPQHIFWMRNERNNLKLVPLIWGPVIAKLIHRFLPGRVAQSVTCLATDASLTAYPGVVSSIPACSHTFVEIDHEIISTVILL